MIRYLSYARDAIELRRRDFTEHPTRRLLVKGTAGLCNRLWYRLYAASFAQRYRWDLCVDWTDGLYAPRGINAFDRLFNRITKR